MRKVIRLEVDKHGKIIGTCNDNLILNSHLYEVEFPYGEVKQFAANIIAVNCILQVDSNCHQYKFLDCITNVRCDHQDIDKADG